MLGEKWALLGGAGLTRRVVHVSGRKGGLICGGL